MAHTALEPLSQAAALVPYGAHEFAKAQARQARSLAVVTRMLRAAGTLEMPLREPIVNGDERDLLPGIYFFDESFRDRHVGVRRSPFNFDYKKKMSSGTADSAHGVLTGELKHRISGHGGATTFDVAAKSHQNRTPEERMTRMLREIRFTRMMKEAGKLHVEPHMLLVDDDKNSALFTHFKQGLYTLDNNAWERGFTKENLALAVAAAHNLGKTNALGICHRDAKIKNHAQDGLKFSGDAHVDLIDYETTILFDPSDPIAVSGAVYDDYGLFAKSLIARQFFSNPSDARRNHAPREIMDELGMSYAMGWAETGNNPGVDEVVVREVSDINERNIDELARAAKQTQNTGIY